MSCSSVFAGLFLLAGIGLGAGCDSDQSPGAADATLSSAIAAEGVSTAEEAVAAAVSWVMAADTEARTALEGGLAGGSGAGEGLFAYTYAAGGQGGRVDSLQDLREPLLPFPLAWQGDTYYLDTTHFSVGAIGGEASPGLAAGVEDIQAGLESGEEDWGRLVSELGLYLAVMRLQDPLRLLEAFTPVKETLSVGEDGRVTLAGHAEIEDVIGSDVLLGVLAAAQAEASQTGASQNAASQAGFLPEQIDLTLTMAAEDWRPLELRYSGPLPDEPGQVVASWARADGGPGVPEGYLPLIDYIRPAADPLELLWRAAAWMEEGPFRVDYPQGSAIHCRAEGSYFADIFQIADLPGEGGWGGAFPDETEVGVLLKAGPWYYWCAEDSGLDWIRADQEQLHEAEEAALAPAAAEDDPEQAALVYRIIVRAYLLDVLDPHWWVEQMRASADRADIAVGAIAVTRTATGYLIGTSFRDDDLFAPLLEYTSLIARIGNPPAAIAANDLGDGPWKYTQQFHLALETDSAGCPLALTLTTNAPSGFALLQSLQMEFQRTDEDLSVPRCRLLPDFLR